MVEAEMMEKARVGWKCESSQSAVQKSKSAKIQAAERVFKPPLLDCSTAPARKIQAPIPHNSRRSSDQHAPTLCCLFPPDAPPPQPSTAFFSTATCRVHAMTAVGSAPGPSEPSALPPPSSSALPDAQDGRQHHPLPFPDVAQLTSRSSIVQALAELSRHSSELDDELVSLFEESEPVVADARRSIASLTPQVQLVQEEAAVLDRRLQASASVAKRISERVRLLDEERKRIALAAEWARKVAELKSSLSLLAEAVEHRDWDMATMHCRRAMAIDPVIRSSSFAAAVVPTTNLPEPPETTLLELRKTMLTAFTDAFIRSTRTRTKRRPRASSSCSRRSAGKRRASRCTAPSPGPWCAKRVAPSPTRYCQERRSIPPTLRCCSPRSSSTWPCLSTCTSLSSTATTVRQL